jgi:hypothetical protein
MINDQTEHHDQNNIQGSHEDSYRGYNQSINTLVVIVHGKPSNLHNAKPKKVICNQRTN